MRARSLGIDAPVDVRDLRNPAPAVGVLERHDLRVGPVKVIGDKGYLLLELGEGVAYDPPAPTGSASNVC